MKITSTMNKACPIVLRHRDSDPEILAFRHPLAGSQIVKGTIEPGETLKKACERELFEESGIRATSDTYLGSWHSNFKNQIWGFYTMINEEPLPERWTHFTNDGGGLEFSFFWHRLGFSPDENFHPLFQRAIIYITSRL